MNSIIQQDKNCFICGSYHWIECHHIFGGANRKNSEKYGLKVFLCHAHHNEPPTGVHFNRELRNKLQREAQEIAMAHYGWSIDEFIQIFGKNHI